MLNNYTKEQQRQLLELAGHYLASFHASPRAGYICCCLGEAAINLNMNARDLQDQIEIALLVSSGYFTYSRWCQRVHDIFDARSHHAGRTLWLAQITEAVLNDLPFPPPPPPPEV